MNKLILTFGDFELKYSELDPEDNIKFIKSVIWNTSKDVNKQEQSYFILREVFSKCLIEKQKTHKVV